ncbi:hypothetical protein ACROYT_G001393 [Oculina patagonica]
MDGCLRFADHLPYDTRHPILLPMDHAVTRLVIVDAHERLGHGTGVEHVLTELRSRFWIVKRRRMVRSFTEACTECRQPVLHKDRQPDDAPLPKSRLQSSLKAFENVGVDYSGPFLTKQGRGKTRPINRLGTTGPLRVTRPASPVVLERLRGCKSGGAGAIVVVWFLRELLIWTTDVCCQEFSSKLHVLELGKLLNLPVAAILPPFSPELHRILVCGDVGLHSWLPFLGSCPRLHAHWFRAEVPSSFLRDGHGT